VVNTFKALSNPVWVVAEEYEIRFSAARIKAMAWRVKLHDPTHLVGVQTNDSDVSFETLATDPNLDVFTAQVGGKEMTTYSHDALQSWLAGQFNIATGRYALELGELYPFHSQMLKHGDRTGLRQSVWAVVMGGAATVMVHGMWDLVNGAAHASAMLGDLERERTIFERTNVHTMSNASAYRSGRTHYARQNTANDYILWSQSCLSGALSYTNITTAKMYTPGTMRSTARP
jgi:hypothetical protein